MGTFYYPVELLSEEERRSLGIQRRGRSMFGKECRSCGDWLTVDGVEIDQHGNIVRIFTFPEVCDCVSQKDRPVKEDVSWNDFYRIKDQLERELEAAKDPTLKKQIIQSLHFLYRHRSLWTQEKGEDVLDMPRVSLEHLLRIEDPIEEEVY